MVDPAFALNLGGGVYLDSDGNIISGPEATTVVYEAPFKLPVEPKKIADALKEVQDALKDADDPTKNPKVLEKITEIYGFLFDKDKVDAVRLLGMLATISKIAGTVAPVLLAVGFAFDVAKMFGLFKEGPSALEQLMVKRFDQLKVQVASIGALIQKENLESGRQAVILLNASVIEFVNNVLHSPLTSAQLEADLVKITNAHEAHVEGLFKLINHSTYETIFDASKHTQVWGLMQHNLVTYPQGPEAPHRAVLPPDNRPVFDHRLMVPLATFAAESYLATARGIVPEYRSTGEFREHLREFAKALGGLVDKMRSDVLARTLYNAQDFKVLLDASEIIRIDMPGFAPDVLVMSPNCGRFPVGALDLRYHDNDYFSAFLSQLFRAEFYGWAHETRKGALNFRWLPPATLEFAGNFGLGGDRYRITNPEVCAAAANAQAELDYAELMSVSGYVQLLQLTTLFRNEATFPSISQTVQIKPPTLLRDPQPATDVTVQSDLRVLTEPLSAGAKREPQKCKAFVEIWTQPTQRVRPIEYTVRLRTLKSFSGSDRWREPLYSAYQFVHYEPDPADRMFMQLLADQRDTAVDETFLVELSSARDAQHKLRGSVELKVHSFDWWIPVKPPFSLTVAFEKTHRALVGLGRDTVSMTQQRPSLATLAQQARRMPDPGARFALSADASFERSIPSLLWQDGAQDWDGQHRDARATTASIEWKLDWQGDRMHIELQAQPADRNYVVYVVVEEKFRGANAPILHTAMPVAMNGQLTYVPQSFFDAEREAMQKAARDLAEFNRKYSQSKKVGPTDPVVGWLRPGDLATVGGIAKAFNLAMEHQPALLREVLDAKTTRPPAG
jgi:hypothetical protein